ncbi:MAG: exodeoxyribonuclease VII small subunit [Ignavibacteriales bacterium]|nr:exodeoxyribonuclease VII small subunit [Ignavibacteriales bacterium]
MTKKKNISFEELLIKLEEITNKLEKSDIGLEESIKLYEEGIIISKECYEMLDKAKLKITELKKEFEKQLDKDVEE